MITREDTVSQSKKTFNRWKDLWIANAIENKKNFKAFDAPKKETGRSCIIFAYGPSFYKNLKKVKEQNLQFHYDIVCVDKAFVELVSEGIVPKYVITADARIDFNECLKMKNIDLRLLKNITLFCCVTGHTSWARAWKENNGRYYFYVNKDPIRSHHVMSSYFNYDRKKGNLEAILIPAPTNVANAAYILTSLILDYNKIYLCAFDYSFKQTSNYYGGSFSETNRDYQKNKKIIDNHLTVLGINNELYQTSESMMFSARWLLDAIEKISREMNKLTVNLTDSGILMTRNCMRLI